MDSNKFIDNLSTGIANLVPAFTGLTGKAEFAAAGALLAPVIKDGVYAVANQVLGFLQCKKIFKSADITCETIVNKLNSNQILRKDAFFNPYNDSILDEEVSSALKLFEGSLLKAKEEYDSKKIPFISFLTANIFFAPNIDESKAFVLLEILSKLSYRQLCALTIFNKRNILPVGRWETRLKVSPNLQNYYDIAYEFLSLKDYLLIEQNQPGQGIGISDYRISALGKELVITANLCSIPSEDLLQLENTVNDITSSLK